MSPFNHLEILSRLQKVDETRQTKALPLNYVRNIEGHEPLKTLMCFGAS